MRRDEYLKLLKLRHIMHEISMHHGNAMEGAWNGISLETIDNRILGLLYGRSEYHGSELPDELYFKHVI